MAATQKAAEVVVRTILDEIRNDGLKQGDRLPPEAAMRSDYSAGRSSIREALRLLETQGLITVKQGRQGGAFVGAPDPEYVGRMLTLFLQMAGSTYEDIATCLAILSPKAAELAAENLDRALVRERLFAAGKADSCHYVLSTEVDQDNLMSFHRTVSFLCGNPVLSLLLDTIESIIVRRIIQRTPAEDRMQWIHSDHEAIADAILAGDGKAAREAQSRHTNAVLDFFRERNCELFRETIQWQ